MDGGRKFELMLGSPLSPRPSGQDFQSMLKRGSATHDQDGLWKSKLMLGSPFRNPSPPVGAHTLSETAKLSFDRPETWITQTHTRTNGGSRNECLVLALAIRPHFCDAHRFVSLWADGRVLDSAVIRSRCQQERGKYLQPGPRSLTRAANVATPGRAGRPRSRVARHQRTYCESRN